MTLAYISHPHCKLHDMGETHPESPARLSAIENHIKASSIGNRLSHYESPQIDRDLLNLAHNENYVSEIFNRSPLAGMAIFDTDTRMNSHSLSAARHAAGAGILGVDLVLSGKHQGAFCAVRPPGHHAERNRAMGFCFFNNIAVAAAYALEIHGLKRVAIVDFDVHHGNGTEHIVASDPRILFCSTFQHPLYPYCGADTQQPNIVNCPLPSGSGSPEFRQAVSDQWLPALNDHRPELMFISAGFDAHRKDFLAGLNLIDDDFGWVTGEIRAVAEKHSRGRIVSILEGGYALNALGRSVVAHLHALI